MQYYLTKCRQDYIIMVWVSKSLEQQAEMLTVIYWQHLKEYLILTLN
jgi:hypothetical protein